jgi:hypothetical protein
MAVGTKFKKTPAQWQAQRAAQFAQRLTAVQQFFKQQGIQTGQQPSPDATQLPDGNWVSKENLEKLKQEWPEGYDILTQQGFTAYGEAVNKAEKTYKSTQALLDKYNALSDKAKTPVPYTTPEYQKYMTYPDPFKGVIEAKSEKGIGKTPGFYQVNQKKLISSKGKYAETMGYMVTPKSKPQKVLTSVTTKYEITTTLYARKEDGSLVKLGESTQPYTKFYEPSNLGATHEQMMGASKLAKEIEGLSYKEALGLVSASGYYDKDAIVKVNPDTRLPVKETEKGIWATYTPEVANALKKLTPFLKSGGIISNPQDYDWNSIIQSKDTKITIAARKAFNLAPDTLQGVKKAIDADPELGKALATKGWEGYSDLIHAKQMGSIHEYLESVASYVSMKSKLNQFKVTNPDGTIGYDVVAFLRKYPDQVDEVERYFPEGTAEEALKFNKEFERTAKVQELYGETTWVNTATGKKITDEEHRVLAANSGRYNLDEGYRLAGTSIKRGSTEVTYGYDPNKDINMYVKDMPALVLSVDPKWQELRNRPDTDPEKIAYKQKWIDEVVDVAMFAAAAATPYTMGGISWLGKAMTIPKMGLRTVPALVLNKVVKGAVIFSKAAALGPMAYTMARGVDAARVSQLNVDFQKFDKLPLVEKNKWADKAGYPADYKKLTDEQKAVVLLAYSKPHDATDKEWIQSISQNLEKMQDYASKGSDWLQEHTPAPVSVPVRFAGGAMVGIVEQAGYAVSIPLLASMLASAAPRGTAPALLKDIKTGMVDFFVKVLPAAIVADPALAAGRITGLFILSPKSMLKLSKAGLARFNPRYVPERAMAIEPSTVRLRFDKVGEFLKLMPKERMRLTEKAIDRLLAGDKEVNIAGAKVTMTVKNVPWQELVGHSLWNFSDRPLEPGSKVYTSPQAAIRFGLMTSTGKAIKGVVLNEIRVPEGYRAKMEKVLSKGETELESIFGKEVKYEEIPGWTGKGISANVEMGAYPIRRFTILGLKSAAKPITPAKLAEVRLLATKEAFVDTFLGWNERMKIVKDAFTTAPKVKRIADSIEKLERATPEATGKYGEITNIRQPVPHPSGKGSMHSRVTAVVFNGKGDVMLVKDVTEQSFGLPGGQVDVKWRPGQMGFKTLPNGRKALTFEGAAHGQVKSETGIGLDKVRYLDTYMGKVNDYALSGSRIYDALAKTDRFKLKKSEIQDALWWDGKSEVTVYPASYDILKGLAKKYDFDMSKVKIDDSFAVLNKARDKAIVKRLVKNKPITDSDIAKLNKTELKSLRKQLYDAAKGRQPQLADWLLGEEPIAELAELLHGRRKATKLSLSSEARANITRLREKAAKTTNTREAARLRREAQMLEKQARDELKAAERQLADYYDTYGRDIYRSDVYTDRYIYWLERLARVLGRPAAEVYSRLAPPRLDTLREEYLSSVARSETPRVAPYQARAIPAVSRQRAGKYAGQTYKAPSYKGAPVKAPPPKPPYGQRPGPVPAPRPEPPPPTKPIPAGTQARKEARRQEFAGATTWKQGFGWWAVKEPYSSPDDVAFFYGEPPPDAQIVKGGVRSAFRSIQSVTGKTPDDLKIDLGIQDILISSPKKKPGAPGAIRFKPDPKQKTRGDITITSTGRGEPRVTVAMVEERLPAPQLGSNKMPADVAEKIGSYNVKVTPDGKIKKGLRRL